LTKKILDELAEIFILRTLNHSSEDVEEAWDSYSVCLIMKKTAPKAPGMLRPIALLPVLSKLYFTILLHIVKDVVSPISVYQFAFKAKHQAAEVVFILKMIIEKANEWSIPFCYLDGDLPKAYDNVLHPLVASRLSKRGVPKFVTSAVIRETRRQKVKIVMGKVESEEVRRTKSLCQGSSDAPKIFNHCFDEDLLEFVKICGRRKWGFPLSRGRDGVYGDFLPIIVFADNFWILGKGPVELQEMCNTWFPICSRAGWDVPHNECAWATTAADYDCRWQLQVEGHCIERRARDDAIKTLGCLISTNGYMDLELDNRIQSAWNAFHSHADSLCSTSPP
jgi:hypothetical protein